MKVVDLDEARNEKTERCEYCGDKAHKAIFACPRIRSITYNNEEDEVVIRFWAEDAPHMAPGVA